MIKPLFFQPIYKETIWGGTGLKECFNREEAPSDSVGESWEIAGHSNGNSVISNGTYKGITLQDLLLKNPVELLGASFKDCTKFPLLIKIIDANQKLSLQVHPDDVYAGEHENGELGKTEMWYILQAKEGSKLVVGAKDGVDKSRFEKALKEGALEPCIKEIEVKAGDVINIPAGMLHAIGEGIMLVEVQQNSDTTYRVYDWNRVGVDGKPRQLHIEQALDVIDFHRVPRLLKGYRRENQGYDLTYYIANEYFAVEKLCVHGDFKEDTKGEKFYLYTCIEGHGEIISDGSHKDEFDEGQSFMIPASAGEYVIVGDATLIRSYVPSKDYIANNNLTDTTEMEIIL